VDDSPPSRSTSLPTKSVEMQYSFQTLIESIVIPHLINITIISEDDQETSELRWRAISSGLNLWRKMCLAGDGGKVLIFIISSKLYWRNLNFMYFIFYIAYLK